MTIISNIVWTIYNVSYKERSSSPLYIILDCLCHWLRFYMLFFEERNIKMFIIRFLGIWAMCDHEICVHFSSVNIFQRGRKDTRNKHVKLQQSEPKDPWNEPLTRVLVVFWGLVCSDAWSWSKSRRGAFSNCSPNSVTCHRYLSIPPTGVYIVHFGHPSTKHAKKGKVC